MFENADLISSYSRKQAIEDGVLVDLSTEAVKHGFKIPFACTSTVWAEIEWDEARGAQRDAGQCTEGRLYDVLRMSIVAASQAKDQSQVHVRVLMVPQDDKSTTAKTYTYNLHVGPGDTGETVITLMQLNED